MSLDAEAHMTDSLLTLWDSLCRLTILRAPSSNGRLCDTHVQLRLLRQFVSKYFKSTEVTKFGRNQISAQCSPNLKTTIRIVQDPTVASRWTRLAHLTTTSRCRSKISFNMTTWDSQLFTWIQPILDSRLHDHISFSIYASKYVEYDEFYLFPRKWYSLVDIDNK